MLGGLIRRFGISVLSVVITEDRRVVVVVIVVVVVVVVVVFVLIFSSSLISSPHFYLTTNSIHSLQLLLHLPVVLHSPPNLSGSLLTQSSHCILGFPGPLFTSTFLAYALFANFLFPILSICPAHFSLLLTTFFLKRSFLQLPLSGRPVCSYPLSSLPQFFLSSCFHKPAPSVVSLLVPSFLSHTCMPG